MRQSSSSIHKIAKEKIRKPLLREVIYAQTECQISGKLLYSMKFVFPNKNLQITK